MNRKRELEPVGVAGLGLMGRGIACCLLSHGLEVIAYERDEKCAADGPPAIAAALRKLAGIKIIPPECNRKWRNRFRLVASVAGLAPCRFVIESITEDLEAKRSLYMGMEAAVPPRTVIASNTSSFPITSLQTGCIHPERFIGMHWGAPAQLMKYLEITPGERTCRRTLRLTKQLAEICGKQPSVLRQDIQGFLSNRLMYAMIREACYLVESGIADIEAVDRSFRNDMGWWALLAGPFRWMDLTGIPAYELAMKGLLPTLSDSKCVPQLMCDKVASGAMGIANGRGFYPYTKRSARQWEKAWIDFNYDVRKLADKYNGK